MTLIAAFRCDDGLVLCADSLETLDGVPVPVRKLEPLDCGAYWLAVGGSGNGDLIDGFNESLQLDVEQWQAGHGRAVIRGLIRNVLIDFLENETRLYPTAYEGDRHNDFLVCVQPKETPEIYLWELRGSVIKSAGNYALIGINEGIYKNEIRRLYPQKPTKQQAIMMGIHLLSFASETSNYVGGETVVISVNAHGMQNEPADQILVRKERVTSLNGVLSSLLLKVATISISEDRIQAAIRLFEGEILGLRREVHTLQISDTLHRHWGDNVSLSVGSVEPESPPQNPRPKKNKKTSRRKKTTKRKKP